MKRKMTMVLAVLLMMAAALAGCGGGSKADAKAPVKEVVDGFMGALAAGEFDKISAFCTEEAVKSQDLASLEQIDDLESSFMDSLGVTGDVISEETRASVTAFVDNLKKDIVSGYEISDVSVDGDMAVVDGTVTFGYDLDTEKTGKKLLEEEMDGVMQAYMQENQEALSKLYTEEGQDAMLGKMFNDLIPSVMDRYAEAIRATDGGTRPLHFAVEKRGDAWLISDIKINLGSTQGDESETEGK